METLVFGLGAIVVLALVVKGFTAYHEAQERNARRAAAAAEDAERERQRGCADVVRFFANDLGYLARDSISRSELAHLLDTGISPEDLARTIWDRCARVPGLILGTHGIAETRIPVVLPEQVRDRHVYVVGKSGSGKTTLLRNLVLQDLEIGHGVAVLAPEQEFLTDELLPFIPEHRWNDVVYVDPADADCPVPLNPLFVEPGEDLDLKVDETMTVFRRVFDDEGGGAAPRMETILRQSLYTLMQIPGSTLLDLEKLLDRGDPTFREWAVQQIPDEDAQHFWRDVYPLYPKDAHLAVVNRLGRFLRPRTVRNLLCSPGRPLNVRAAMDDGKVLLVNLSDGVLGEQNAQVLGQLVVAKLQLAAMSRADSPKAARRPFYVYLDEFQSFCGVAAASYEKILSRARKYGLGLTLAHQQTGQIPEHLMREILGNVSTVVSFAVSASDAKRLARELVGEIDGRPVPLAPEQLLSLRVGEAWCRINRSVFFMPTLPAPEGGNAAVRVEVIRRSRLQHGVSAGQPKLLPRHTETSSALHANGLEAIDPGSVF